VLTCPEVHRFEVENSEAGAKTREVCHERGISAATLYAWKPKFGGMEVSGVPKLRSLEDENRRVKRLLTDSALEIDALKRKVWDCGFR
jgi:putative transposase